MTSPFTHTLIRRTGAARKPAMVGIFTVFFLFSTSLVAAPPETASADTGTSNVAQGPNAPTKLGNEASATGAAPSKTGQTVNTKKNNLRGDKASSGKLNAAKPPVGTLVEIESKAKEVNAEVAVTAKPAVNISQAKLPVLDTKLPAKVTLADAVTKEKLATASSQTDQVPGTMPLESNSTTKAATVLTSNGGSSAGDKTLDNTTTGTDDTLESTAEDAPEKAPMPVAEDVDLSKPVIIPSEPVQPVAPQAPEPDPVLPEPTKEVEAKPPLVLLGEEVAPGTSARLSWSPDQHFDGISVPTPVLVVNGIRPGKTLCLTAAVHGDELNGIEIVRRVMYDLNPKELDGAVIGVPIVNLQGFRRNTRYLPDRRDLNRFFPGNVGGSSASRMAHSFFTQVIRHCDALVDIHTGSFLRTNLPQLRADMSVPEVAELTEGFGATAVLHSSSTGGTLRRAAVLAGIPAVTLETGEPSRLQEKEIEHGTKGVQTLLTKLKMTRRVRVWGDPEPVYYKSIWVRADDGGLLFTGVKLGQRIRKGQVLGTITDPITNVRSEVLSPIRGRVLGMALNQVVLPGFATFRIGIPSNEKEVVVPTDPLPEGTPEKVPSDIPESVPTDVDIEDENS